VLCIYVCCRLRVHPVCEFFVLGVNFCGLCVRCMFLSCRPRVHPAHEFCTLYIVFCNGFLYYVFFPSSWTCCVSVFASFVCRVFVFVVSCACVLCASFAGCVFMLDLCAFFFGWFLRVWLCIRASQATVCYFL